MTITRAFSESTTVSIALVVALVASAFAAGGGAEYIRRWTLEINHKQSTTENILAELKGIAINHETRLERIERPAAAVDLEPPREHSIVKR